MGEPAKTDSHHEKHKGCPDENRDLITRLPTEPIRPLEGWHRFSTRARLARHSETIVAAR